MSQNETVTHPPPDGLKTRAQIAEEWGCCEHTIRKWEQAGLPVIKVGKFRYYRPEAVRAWVLSHEQSPQEPRRGRPRKLAA